MNDTRIAMIAGPGEGGVMIYALSRGGPLVKGRGARGDGAAMGI